MARTPRQRRTGVAEPLRLPAMPEHRDRTIGSVGVTFAKARVANPRITDGPSVELEFLIDTGAIYSVVPAAVLENLGVVRLERHDFTLADGTHRAYDVGEASFELAGRARTSQVVFGPAGVTPLLGAFALESLGLMINPVTRELLPMRLLLAAHRRAAERPASSPRA